MLAVGQAGEQRGDFGLALAVERCEGAPAGAREAEVEMACVARRAFAADQLLLLQRAQQAAEIPGVEVEIARELDGGRAVAVGELPEEARFGQREAGVGELLVEDADAARIEAVEAAKGGGARGADGFHAAMMRQMVA